MSQRCRNCDSPDVKNLGFVGEVAPFFLKRVLNLEIRDSISRHPLRRLARRLLAFPRRLFEAVYGSRAFTEMEVCLDCSFVQTKHSFSDESLARLYADYRSDSYNRERIHYEPTYAAVAPSTGVSEQEVSVRVQRLTEWLRSKIESERLSMLDFGGSDGRFLPAIPGEKFVFEISDSTPKPGVTKIDRESELRIYDYVQLAHVLEHVASPLELLRKVARRVKSAGYLYLEVPQELTDSEFSALKNGNVGFGLPVHEHINLYSQSSVAALVKSAGLRAIAIHSESLDLGWTKCIVIRALCTTNPSSLGHSSI